MVRLVGPQQGGRGRQQARLIAAHIPLLQPALKKLRVLLQEVLSQLGVHRRQRAGPPPARLSSPHGPPRSRCPDHLGVRPAPTSGGRDGSLCSGAVNLTAPSSAESNNANLKWIPFSFPRLFSDSEQRSALTEISVRPFCWLSRQTKTQKSGMGLNAPSHQQGVQALARCPLAKSPLCCTHRVTGLMAGEGKPLQITTPAERHEKERN